MHLSIQGLNSQEVILNCVYELVPIDKMSVSFSVRLFIPQLNRKTVIWNHSSTYKFTLKSSFSPLTKQWTRWAICAPVCRTERFPTLSCQGICFSASANGSNYTTDTYNSVLSLLTHHPNLYRSILFLKSVSNNATTCHPSQETPCPSWPIKFAVFWLITVAPLFGKCENTVEWWGAVSFVKIWLWAHDEQMNKQSIILCCVMFMSGA